MALKHLLKSKKVTRLERTDEDKLDNISSEFLGLKSSKSHRRKSDPFSKVGL